MRFYYRSLAHHLSRFHLRLLFAMLTASTLVACGTPNNVLPGRTIADLPDAEVPRGGREVPEVAVEELVENYLEVLAIVEDAKVRQKVTTRLADLEMTLSEDALVEGSSDDGGGLFSAPIELYENLIAEQGEQPAEDQDTERLLYQLSKAYALDGQSQASNQALERLLSEYPDSQFAAEAEFRLAERAFSNNDYTASKKHYGNVVALGETTDFYQNSQYMLGWSEFKLNRYQPALTSFISVLDLTIGENSDLENLTNTQKNLAEDTLRVSSIAFSYLGGAISIEETMQVLGDRSYDVLLYQSLGDLYVSQERFRDAADTYDSFVTRNPLSDQAPEFSVAAIQTYYDGNFPSLILPAKEDFIVNYGIKSDYWVKKGNTAREELEPYLYEYLVELASFNHALAQDNAIELEAQDRINTYLKAAVFYNEFIATFPNDPKVPESAFLMGEAFYAARDFENAANAYEAVAYNYDANEYGANAGFNAILAIDQNIGTEVDISRDDSAIPRLSLWQQRKVDSSIRYADVYVSDERAPGVLAQAGDLLFENNQLEKAIEISRRITLWEPSPNIELLRNSWLIIGHGRFDLEQFTDAEQAYRQLLSILPAEDGLVPEIEERIAASVYRQGERLAAAGQLPEAVEKLLSIRTDLPLSEIAITGHFDAINYLIELKDWSRASAELTRFLSSYPDHPLATQIPAKQAFVYQEQEQWEPAAIALLAFIELEEDPEVKRESLYLAAELFMKANNDTRAEETYERYVANYPRPEDLAMEAYFQLAELNKNDLLQRNTWLKTIISNANKSNSRATYLGAWAAADLANQQYQKFTALQLTLPLKTSLKAKQASLADTLEAYNEVLDFGVAEFTTLSSYRIGEIYGELSRAMLNSERPDDLDALALEQYEILLEEQAYPFEEKAIEVHEANSQRSWNGDYDDWIKDSFAALAKLLPGRYNKIESRDEVSRGIH